MNDTHAGAEDELFNSNPVRNSVDSQGMPLEALVEEDEDVSTLPIDDELFTASTVPIYAARPRPTSQDQGSRHAEAEAEEQLMMRAAAAAQVSRSGAAPDDNGYGVIVEVVKETTVVASAEDDVPRVANGHFKASEEVLAIQSGLEEIVTEGAVGGMGREFEWPEDVF